MHYWCLTKATQWNVCIFDQIYFGLLGSAALYGEHESHSSRQYRKPGLTKSCGDYISAKLNQYLHITYLEWLLVDQAVNQNEALSVLNVQISHGCELLRPRRV